MNIEIHIIPYAQNNYAYLVADKKTKEAILIDCGEASPILQYIAEHKLQLKAVLLTHLHHDHMGGLKAVQHAYPGIPVYSGSEQTTYTVYDQQTLTFNHIEVKVYDLTSHSKYDRGFAIGNAFFSGDVLFSAGCGRLFDGDANDLFHAFAKIQSLPKNTKIYFAHEYTQANIAFAKTIEPDNQDLQVYEQEVQALRLQRKYTTPTTLATELNVNPFLRVDTIESLKKLRDQKNNF